MALVKPAPSFSKVGLSFPDMRLDESAPNSLISCFDVVPGLLEESSAALGIAHTVCQAITAGCRPGVSQLFHLLRCQMLQITIWQTPAICVVTCAVSRAFDHNWLVSWCCLKPLEHTKARERQAAMQSPEQVAGRMSTGSLAP